jgi:hypothetical protein
VLIGPFFTWKPTATALATPPIAIAKTGNGFQKAGCLLAGRYCRVGYHWVCGLPPNPERRRCHCVPC